MTELQLEILHTMSRSRTVSLRLVQRSRILLLAFAGYSNDAIAARVGLERHQVGWWRQRWSIAQERLTLIECTEDAVSLCRAIRNVLGDEPRRGSPGKFSAEQVAGVVAIACEPPANSGRPVTHWTARELADEVAKRGIVDSISPSQVGRFLRDADLKPHRRRDWLNMKEKDPKVFGEQVRAVCNAYHAAPNLYHAFGIHTVCLDEMTGVQALERIAATLPMEPGKPERIEFEYERHGTLCLIGNLDGVTGRILVPTIGPTRTEKDFVEHVRRLIETDPKKGWNLVTDNRNIHCSEGLVRFVAQQCDIDLALGVKGRRGILKSMNSRRRFLSDPSHRIRFVLTPTHSSWLNQIEIWFGILTRRVLHRGNFASVEELRHRILEFIDYFNRTVAKPFRWTYTGRVLQAGLAA